MEDITNTDDFLDFTTFFDIIRDNTALSKEELIDELKEDL